MLEFNNIDIIIGNTGIIAESATLSTNNSIQGVNLVGYNNFLSYASFGGISSNLTINYISHTQAEPVIDFIRKYKIEGSGVPIRCEVAGLFGQFYLQSFQFKATPNQPIKSTVSFVGFEELQGEILQRRGAVYYATGKESIGHGWTSFITSSGTYIDIPTYEFNYSINFNISPIFSIGNKIPVQVLNIDAAEKIDVTRGTYARVSFTGESAAPTIFNSNNNSVEIFGIGYNWDENNSDKFNFDFRGGKITNSNLDIRPNEYITTKTTIIKNY